MQATQPRPAKPAPLTQSEINAVALGALALLVRASVALANRRKPAA